MKKIVLIICLFFLVINLQAQRIKQYFDDAWVQDTIWLHGGTAAEWYLPLNTPVEGYIILFTSGVAHWGDPASITPSANIDSYQYELSSDSENAWTIPITLNTTSVIIYNGSPLRASQWSGVGTTTLTVTCQTKRYDYLTILK